MAYRKKQKEKRKEKRKQQRLDDGGGKSFVHAAWKKQSTDLIPVPELVVVFPAVASNLLLNSFYIPQKYLHLQCYNTLSQTINST